MAPQITASSILRKLEGEKAAIGLQANSMASLVIDDPLRVFTKAELQEIVYQLTDGQLRSRLETALAAGGWEISASAVRFAINDGSHVCGVRLVKGNHVRLR